MQVSALFQYLNAITPDGNMALIEALVVTAETHFYSRQETIFPQGKTVDRLIFLETGSAAAIQHTNNHATILRFWVDKQLICATGSFFTQTPVAYSIIALENCAIATLSFSKLRDFTKAHPDGWHIVMRLLLQEIDWHESRINNLRQTDNAQRYNSFKNNYHKIGLLVKSEWICSFLNISYSTLKRLKLRHY